MDKPLTLTRKQTSILGLYAAGQTTAEIAKTLHTTRGAVKRHAASIRRKLGARTTAAAARSPGG